MHKVIVLFGLMVFSSYSLGESEMLKPCKDRPNSRIQVVEHVAPKYPTSHRALVNGWVKLEVRVDSEGRAVNMQIVDAFPKRVFERSARKAVMKWKFSKSSSNELRCGITVVEFKLED